MNRKRVKQYLLLLLAIGVIAVVATGSGTFASFSAETTNSGNTFATGTLVLKNSVGSTVCLSTGGGTTDTNTNSTGCAKVIDVGAKVPGYSTTGTVDIKNDGSLNSSKLTFTPSSCTPGNAAGETYHGTGDPCTVLDVYVQEVDGSSNNVSCLYGGGTATACAFDDAKTLSGLSSAGANLGAINAGATRHFVVGLKLQSSAGNTFQGRAASFDLTWTADQ
jgi:predicted ribosomally synthesized peptide with SipW-like signal peptide